MKTILRITVALFFLLKLFSSHLYCFQNLVKLFELTKLKKNSRIQ